jgi:hypothetical protein
MCYATNVSVEPVFEKIINIINDNDIEKKMVKESDRFTTLKAAY